MKSYCWVIAYPNGGLHYQNGLIDGYSKKKDALFWKKSWIKRGLIPKGSKVIKIEVQEFTCRQLQSIVLSADYKVNAKAD